ncbi:uncharacterized protein N0V89_009257 [Didymosphaeria variabile]|uniref:C2H2-type domain-containing protein n=1 Tax=Didymosphaeria variabile TaxID=1932322 RepID=A0A9W8XDK8_9PLEO|nr:uncharacterized protein N0V89_009257 [Didymosphaeria variabile]KAJ4347885.1 hypothetical protein N0V89_009257 [Didymosphaeria variabile]
MPRSSAKSHQSIFVPPDVLAARRENTTASMLAQLHEPPPVANPSPFRGFGLYTDVEVEVPQNDPRLAHKPYTVKKFLPLGGPQHVHNKRRKRDDLPDEVLRMYNELEAILLREEDAEKRDARQDPQERFKPMKCPGILVPPPSLPPPLSKPTETTITILKANKETRAEIGEKTMEETIGETMEKTRENTRKETGKEVRKEIREEPGNDSHKDNNPDTNSSDKSTEVIKQGTVKVEETQDVADLSTQESGEIWEDDSDVEIIESRPVQKRHLPVYNMAQLFCCACNVKIGGNLRAFTDHMLKIHFDELDSIYYRCCADHYWNASLTSYVPHWGGVHGWGKEPFPCPKCAANFQSIPELRGHLVKVHQNSVSTTPKSLREVTPKASVDYKSKSSVGSIQKSSQDPTPASSVAPKPKSVYEPERTRSVGSGPHNRDPDSAQHAAEPIPPVEHRPPVSLPPRPQFPRSSRTSSYPAPRAHTPPRRPPSTERVEGHPAPRAHTLPRRPPSTGRVEWHPEFRPPTSPRRDRPPAD